MPSTTPTHGHFVLSPVFLALRDPHLHLRSHRKIGDCEQSTDQGGCYLQRPKAEVDNTLRDLQNSSYPTKAEFNDCFIIHQKYFPVFKGVLPFCSLFFHSPNMRQPHPRFSRSAVQSAAGCTFEVIGLIIWSTAAGYGALCGKYNAGYGELWSIISLLFIQNISPFLKEFHHFALSFHSPNIRQPHPRFSRSSCY